MVFEGFSVVVDLLRHLLHLPKRCQLKWAIEMPLTHLHHHLQVQLLDQVYWEDHFCWEQLHLLVKHPNHPHPNFHLRRNQVRARGQLQWYRHHCYRWQQPEWKVRH